MAREKADREWELEVEELTVRVREMGDPEGEPVIHFHGTPGSRLELAWAWAQSAMEEAGVRMIAFDRPGYGGSTRARFSLRSVAELATRVADAAGLAEFRTIGWSGGGPFALATAVTAPDRVRAVGIVAGAGPFQLVPGALEELSEGDAAAERLLPGDPEGAAAGFLGDFDLSAALVDSAALYEAFEPMLCAWDRDQWRTPGRATAILEEMREALRVGAWGCAWDNVAWIGDWDVDPTTVSCPVRLWYGSEDRMALPAHAYWYEENLPSATLTMREGEGHLLPHAHLPEMLQELLT